MMPKYLVNFRGIYLEWSTVVDAPTIIYGTREAMMSYKPDPERVARLDKFGTSSAAGTSAEDLLEYNRAGEDEACLTLDELEASFREAIQAAEEAVREYMRMKN